VSRRFASAPCTVLLVSRSVTRTSKRLQVLDRRQDLVVFRVLLVRLRASGARAAFVPLSCLLLTLQSHACSVSFGSIMDILN